LRSDHRFCRQREFSIYLRDVLVYRPKSNPTRMRSLSAVAMNSAPAGSRLGSGVGPRNLLFPASTGCVRISSTSACSACLSDALPKFVDVGDCPIGFWRGPGDIEAQQYCSSGRFGSRLSAMRIDSLNNIGVSCGSSVQRTQVHSYQDQGGRSVLEKVAQDFCGSAPSLAQPGWNGRESVALGRYCDFLRGHHLEV